jgi:uncharacterized iron-regulated membrane protein
VPATVTPTVSVAGPVAMARERWPGHTRKVVLPRAAADPYELTALPGTGPISVGVPGVDRYPGAVLCDNHYPDLPWDRKARQRALPVHQASVYGLPTKVLGAAACLGLAGLAVTGLWMWLARGGRVPRAANGPVPVPAGEWVAGRPSRSPSEVAP